MPQTRTAGRTRPAYRDYCAPYQIAGILDSQTGVVPRRKTGPISRPRPRNVERSQRVKLGGRKTRPKILSGLPHRRRDRAPSFHSRKRVYRTVGSGQPTQIIANRPIKPFDQAVIATLRRRHGIDDFPNGGSRTIRGVAHLKANSNNS
jgi:hypothetical protein